MVSYHKAFLTDSNSNLKLAYDDNNNDYDDIDIYIWIQIVILLIIISISILTIIGVANAVYNNTSAIANSNLQNQRSYNQCDDAHALHIKMFDSQTVPKYIIGKDYKITPVSPTTTDVLINRCSLAAEGISQ